MPRKPTGRPPGRPRHPDPLTPAEQRVLGLLREGRSNPEIAKVLGISLDAVKYHVSNMLGKLGYERRDDLALWQPGREPAKAWRTWVFAPLTFFRSAAKVAQVLTTAVVGLGIVGAAIVVLRHYDRGSDAATALLATQTTSPTGRVVFVSDRGADPDTFPPPLSLYVANADGSGVEERLTDPVSTGSQGDPAWSPDGTKLAWSSHPLRGQSSGIFVMNADGGAKKRLTDGETDSSPDWSPDGSRIAFVSNRDGNSEIYVMNADGSTPVRLTNDPASDEAPDWSPDGARIVFRSGGAKSDSDYSIYVMNADGTGRTRLTSGFDAASDPAWSPSGDKIAFVSSREVKPLDGSAELTVRRLIYVMSVDGSNPTSISDDFWDAQGPAWSPDGEYIAWWGCATPRGFGCFREDNEIFIARPDGSKWSQLTLNSAFDSTPAWAQSP